MEEEKGATNQQATEGTKMIDTSATPKKAQPLLKLGRKKLGMNRQQQLEEPQSFTCMFRDCGRKFNSDFELSNHMQRRHRAPPAQQEASAASVDKVVQESTTEASTPKQETPIPSKAKASGIIEVKSVPQRQAAAESMKQMKSHDFSGAKPRVVARPATASAHSQKMPAEQVNILRAMMQQPRHNQGDKKVTFGGIATRPKTAATSTAHDEKRIKDKLKYLDEVFNKIESEVNATTEGIDIDFFRGKQNPALKDPLAAKKGVRLTKQMVLSNAMMCDDLHEVTTLMLRDKNISVFDDNPEEKDDDGVGFKVVDMCNIECLMASHNLIRDVSGVLQLTTLSELNLSYNQITDITGIEELTQLRTLQLNHNKILSIDSVAKLLNLKQLGLFFNEIIDSEHTMSILMKCTKLRELAIEGNPCARQPEFGYELLMRLPGLKVLNEEAVQELDRDVAEQYYEMYELTKPLPWQEEVKIESRLKSGETGAGQVTKDKKCVRFQEVDADDLEECGHEKDLKKMQERLEELELEKFQLQQKLTKTKQDEVYRENEQLNVQLKNMYYLMEENELMRAELDALKASTFDERTAEVAQDNERLRRRNGELQIELMDTKKELGQLKKATAHLPNDASAQQQALLMGGSMLPQRPQTAAVRSTPLDQMLSDPNFDVQSAQDDIDRELAEMMQRNQARLAELHNDLKDVSKLTEEPYVNVRKMKQPSVPQRKQLNAIRKGQTDENIDAI